MASPDATCKTCGGQPGHHRPSMLDRDGVGDPGHRMSAKPTTCPTCGGSGQLDERIAGTSPGDDDNYDCPTCHNTGQVAAEQPERDFKAEAEAIAAIHKEHDYACTWCGKRPTPPTEARELEHRVETVLLAYGLSTVSEVAEANAIKALVRLITTEANRLAGEREAKQLGVFVADLYNLADGNTGEGIWELHDKYAAALSAYPKGASHG